MRDDEVDTTERGRPRVEVEKGLVPEQSVRKLLAELDVLGTCPTSSP